MPYTTDNAATGAATNKEDAMTQQEHINTLLAAKHYIELALDKLDDLDIDVNYVNVGDLVESLDESINDMQQESQREHQL